MLKPTDRSLKAYRRVSDKLGTTYSIARECGVSAVAVFKWQRNGLPRGWAMLLEETHGIPYVSADFKVKEGTLLKS